MKPSYSITEWFSREWFAFFILVLGVLSTVFFAMYANQAALSKEKIQFENFVQRTQEELSNELDTYVALLRASSGLLESNENTTLEEFRTFVDKLDLREKYPGVLGVGFARSVAFEDVPSYETEMRALYTVFSLSPEYVKPTYFPITFLEPNDARNTAVLGYDISSDATRWEAMQKARDTGQPTASGKLLLLPANDSNSQSGFVLYSPIYAGESEPQTLEERRNTIIGFVFSPFQAGDFISSLQSVYLTSPGLHFAIYDGSSAQPENLLYQSTNSTLKNLQTSPFTRTVVVNASGRVWTMEFWTTSNFGDSIERDFVPIILAGGFTISFLLFLLSRSQYLALLEAQRRTAELRVSQQELRQSRGQYQLVVENTEDLVNLLDMEGKYIYASPSHANILGYSNSDLIDTSMLSFVHEEDRKHIEKEFSKITNGRSAKTIYRFKHRKGHYVTLEGVGSGISDDTGIPYVMVTTSRDISQRVELEKRKDEFISIASHELKTPVTSIKAYAQYLKTRFAREGDAQSSLLLEKMDRQLNKLTILISDLLDVTKIEAGKLQMSREYFDLNELAAELVEEVQRTTDTHTILLEGSIRRKNFGDRERIGQVITNFLSNAIKYSPEGKEVRVRLSATAMHAQVSVKDNGIGIAPDKHKKLFSRFFRIDGNKQETFPGLGLGLYISAQIIRRHKGKIWVESEPGNGATFCFTLPFKKQQIKAQGKTPGTGIAKRSS